MFDLPTPPSSQPNRVPRCWFTLPRVPTMRMLFAVIFALMLGGAAADAKVSITIDKSRQRISVSADGRQLYNRPVSTGRAGRDTPGGEYRAFRMEKDHYSKEWD